MFIRKSEGKRLLDSLQNDLKSKLHHDLSMLNDFQKDKDWAFVIKSHALLESAVTEFLVSHIGDKKLHPVFERLPISDSRIGKIALLEDLDLLDREQRKFIRWFSELRNKLVHKVENVKFSFEKFLKSLDSNQKRSWLASSICFGSNDPKLKEKWLKIAEVYPRASLFMSLWTILTNCICDGKDAEAIRKINLASEETINEFFKKK